MTGHRGTGKHWAASTSRVAPKYLRVGSLKVLAYIERSTAQTAMTRIEHATSSPLKPGSDLVINPTAERVPEALVRGYASR